MMRLVWSGLLTSLISAGGLGAQTSGPERRVGHGAVYHPAMEMVLVFGGRAGDGVELNDLWGWDGARWNELDDGTEGPPARSRHATAFDRRRSRLVVHGGGTVQRDLADSWAWTEEGWTPLGEAGPGPRSHHQMTYEPGEQSVLLYGGGRERDGFGSDLWRLGDSGWSRVSRGLPPGRVLSGMETTDAGVLLFGGLIRGRPPSRELWEWRDGRWTLLAESGPTGRISPGLAWDRARGELILFGGETDGGLAGATWSWDGVNWTRREIGFGPPARTEHVLAYDEARSVVVLFGGRTREGVVDDVWEWDGETWERRR